MKATDIERERSTNLQALSDTLGKLVDDYLHDYELDDGEHCPYPPNEAERALICDAVHGLLADDEIVDAIVTQRLAALSSAGRAVAEEPLCGKYGNVLAPFVALMDAELHANAAKGDRPGWLGMSRDVALLEIYWHTAKLSAAVKNNDAALIREHSADVANMAMMLLDVCGGLEVA